MDKQTPITELLNTLNPQQRHTVEYFSSPQLIIAGAGSGKTRVLITKIVYCCKILKIDAEKILAITFSNKASAELQKRIAPFNLYPVMGTFHSICLRILQKHGRYIGMHDKIIVCDTQDQIEMLKECIETLSLDKKTYPPSTLAEWISRMKDDLQEPNISAIDEPIYHRIYDLYEKKMTAQNAVDFGDLICKTVRLLEQFPDLREYYHKKFTYIFVDEYQDTNTAQAMFLRLIAGQDNFVCVVGDPDQSIYGWRGANINNILLFEDAFLGAKRFKLEQNYRSTPIILNATNLLIKSNKHRYDKQLWTTRQVGEKIFYERLSSDRQEAKSVTNHIIKKHKNGVDYKDIAIFYRTHSLSRCIEEALLRQAIPYTVVGGLPFYQRKEIKDIVSYLRILANPEDRISWKRIINVPPRRIGKQTILKISHINDVSGNSFYTELRNHTHIPKLTRQAHCAIDFLLNLIDQHKPRLTSDRWDDICRDIIADIGYFEFIKKTQLPEKTAVRIANISTLLEALAEYQQEHEHADISSFLEHIALRSGVDEWVDDENRVTMMTLHCAKGLEFPYVFIIGLEDGMLPYIRNDNEMDEIEEERRLCYVGMTRAISQLYLFSCQQRFTYSQPITAPPSRFISELPEDLIEYTDSTEKPVRSYHFGKQIDTVASDQAFNIMIDHFSPGDRVYHCDIGTGKILGGSGRGEKKKYIILFDGDTKPMTVYASFAGLSKLD